MKRHKRNNLSAGEQLLYNALKAMGGGILSDATVNYLTYGFGCCVYQAGGDASKLTASALQGVDHAFNKNHHLN